MRDQGWTRRLDDHADRLLRRRFGFGIRGGPILSPRKHLLIALGTAVAVEGIVVVALVVTGQAVKAPIILGPVVGITLGTVLGQLIQKARQRR